MLRFEVSDWPLNKKSKALETHSLIKPMWYDDQFRIEWMNTEGSIGLVLGEQLAKRLP